MKDTTISITDENNNIYKSLTDSFDCEPGYYYQVIRPMLTPGHETELIFWLKNVGLIPNHQVCTNSKDQQDCNKIMEWLPVKSIDYFQWKCKNCCEKKSIRKNSIFQDVKCNLKNSIRILLGWCKGYDVATMSDILGVKKQTVRTLYNVVASTARKHLKLHNEKIGGPGTIVIIDTYPEGFTNVGNQTNRPILCIAEVKDVPPNYWFEPLNRYNKTNKDQINLIKDHILKVIEEMVEPGSILIARRDATLCSIYDLQTLSSLFPTMVSVEALEQHNTERTNVINNLETIWQLALNVCEQAQLFSYDQVPHFLTSHMWLSRFGNEAFETLLNRLSDWQ